MACSEKKNAGRSQRFEEERKALGTLPAKPLPFFGTVESEGSQFEHDLRPDKTPTVCPVG